MPQVSYSQYQTYSSCPLKYKLRYIDKHKVPSGIHAIFGTAVHNTIQHFLTVYYNVTKKQAKEINLEKLLQQHLMDEFAKESEQLPDGEFVCSREEIEEFYWQGVEIIRWLVKDKNLGNLFRKKGYELVGVEVPINIEIRNGVRVIGFIDIVLRDSSGNYLIIDLKTSTKGWSKWQKDDDSKKNQIILYKLWYSEQYNVPVDKINVEFHIMRRILPDPNDVEFTVPRISRFAPPSGKIKQNQAKREFDWFLDEVFDSEGNYKDKEYIKKPGSHCNYCDYLNVFCDGKA